MRLCFIENLVVPFIVLLQLQRVQGFLLRHNFPRLFSVHLVVPLGAVPLLFNVLNAASDHLLFLRELLGSCVTFRDAGALLSLGVHGFKGHHALIAMCQSVKFTVHPSYFGGEAILCDRVGERIGWREWVDGVGGLRTRDAVSRKESYTPEGFKSS